MAKKNPPKPSEEPQEQIAKIAFKGWRDHLSRFSSLQKKIEGLLDDAIKKALANGGKLTADDIGRVFQKHPEIKRDLDAAIETLNKDLVAVIEKDSKDAWLRAQTNAQEITKTLAASNAQLAALLASGEDKAQNDRALRAFMKRKEAGMNLSDRVWKTTLGMKLDMERAIDVALAEGMSADRLSLKIRELLKEPHRLYRRVRDKDGNLRLSQAAQKYHPGTGVYRSSYKNALRVARTEVNMAYQTSDSERWTNSWWVKGIRISLSNNHTIENAKGEKERLVDICDELAGDYPPDFKFTGWHPQCRCFATAITCSYDEIREYYRRKRAGEDMTGYEPKGLIKEPPQKFKNWMERNADRLARAAERGTTPYFITNNPKYTDPEWKPEAPPKPTIQERMDERRAKSTEVKFTGEPHSAMKTEYKTNAEVDETFKEINKDFTSEKWFEHGDLSLAKETDPKNNGSTDMKGGIYLAQSRLDYVRSALAKIGNKKTSEITFEEADAMATFWHEITHNRSVPGNMYLTKTERRFMELANEFVARHSLDEFYAKLGASKVPHPEFMNNRASTGYNEMVTNYDYVINELGLDRAKVTESVRNHLFNEKYSDQKTGLQEGLINGGLKYADGRPAKNSDINSLLKLIRTTENVRQYDLDTKTYKTITKEEIILEWLKSKGFVK